MEVTAWEVSIIYGIKMVVETCAKVAEEEKFYVNWKAGKLRKGEWNESGSLGLLEAEVEWKL